MTADLLRLKELCIERGSAVPRLGIAFVAMKRNIADLPAVIRLGQKLGADRFSVSNVLAHTPEMREHPIGPDGLRGAWTFESVKPGSHRIEGFDVVAFDVPHKGGRTFGYRVSDGSSSIAYIPDHCPELDSTPAIARECEGVDLLLHDAQFLEHERAVADLYGHATVDDAIDLARRCRRPGSPSSTTRRPAGTTRWTRSGPRRSRPARASAWRCSSPARRTWSSSGADRAARDDRTGGSAAAVTSVPMSIRVVIAEDSYLVREGVVRLLEAQDGVEVVGACGDLDELLATVERELPDVVLTDIRMPPTGTDEGVRAANFLREQHPDIGVVMLSQYAEPAYALALLEHGSAGRAYLLKERVSDVDQLLRAIREVADGGSVIDPRIVEGLVEAAVAAPGLAARAPHAARERGARRDGAGPQQRGHRRRARPVGARGREAHQLAVLEARALGGDRRAPPRQGGAGLPVGPRRMTPARSGGPVVARLGGRSRAGGRSRMNEVLATPFDGVGATWANVVAARRMWQ